MTARTGTALCAYSKTFFTMRCKYSSDDVNTVEVQVGFDLWHQIKKDDSIKTFPPKPLDTLPFEVDAQKVHSMRSDFA